MRRVAIALSLSGVLLLATWVQAPAEPAREEIPLSRGALAEADQVAQATVPAARQVDEEAERLRQHLAAQTPFSEPVRNPFRFNTSEKPAPQPVPSALMRSASIDAVELNVPAAPAIVMPLLIGVAEDTVAGVVVRTAMLSLGDEMGIVKIGQPFSRFVVQAISATSVELIDVTSPNRNVTTITIR